MSHVVDLTAYLRRVGLPAAEDWPPTVATLRRLQRAHVDAIPFANVAPALGLVPPLDLPTLERRMVAEGCGGYCMEHVTLFGAVLAQLGFPTALRLCLVGDPRDATLTSRPPTHLTVLARPADDPRRWMADVGFGVGVLGPVPLPLTAPGSGEPVRHGAWTHRADVTADGRIILLESGASGWRPLHASVDEDVDMAAIERANRWVALEQGSPFAGRLVAMRTTDDRRERLRGRRLEIVQGDEEPRIEELTPADALAVLRTRFGVAAEPPELAALEHLLATAPLSADA